MADQHGRSIFCVHKENHTIYSYYVYYYMSMKEEEDNFIQTQIQFMLFSCIAIDTHENGYARHKTIFRWANKNKKITLNK